MAAFYAEPISDFIPPVITAVFYWRKLGWVRKQAESHSAIQA